MFKRNYHVVVSVAVDGSMNSVHVVADVLHNIDLTITRPVQWSIGGQQPESRPGSTTVWQFRSDFIHAVFEVSR